jgi:ribosome recycling factor
MKGFFMEPFKFIEGETKGLDAVLRQEMESPIKHFEKELVAIRTGRASSSIVNDIKVECYGQMMPLNQVATIATPDSRLITIQPWDKGNIVPIEKALKLSDVGITPINDGEIIRLQLPLMSSDRREELVKLLNKKTEECKVGIRNVRKEYHNQLRNAERKHDISEDHAHRLNDTLQGATDDYIKKANALHDKKASELKAV